MAVKPSSAPAHQAPDLSSLCHSITEHAPLPIVTVEGTSHIVRYANPAFCRLMARRKEELVGKPFVQIMPEETECVTLLDRVYRTGQHETHTESVASGPHPVFWSYTMWPVLSDEHPVGVIIQVTETGRFHEQAIEMNQQLLLGSVRQHELVESGDRLNARLQREIAERKEAQQALMEAKAALADEAVLLERLVAERTAELTSTNKQLEAFVYTIAHDLRAPLRAMQGFAMMLIENEGGALSATGQGYAQTINKSARFMDALLTDLLAFASITQQHIELAPTDLQPVVQEVLSRLEKETAEQNAHVETIGPWPAVMAHAPTLSQVLFNLLSNSLKFAKPDVPPQIRLRAEERIGGLMDTSMSEQSSTNPTIHSLIHPPPPAAWVRVWVEDNGIGIAREHQEQIFRLFLRLHRDAYGGTGVGLAIVQKGVERMGGAVGVESSSGHGSRFWFDLRKAPNAG
jgi:PAS domain S-box-containing protein